MDAEDPPLAVVGLDRSHHVACPHLRRVERLVERAHVASGQMPHLVHKMVSVGEATGRLDDMFDKVAGFYEDEIETATEALVKALEPMFILVVGVILGSMVVALYLPIFTAMTSLA